MAPILALECSTPQHPRAFDSYSLHCNRVCLLLPSRKQERYIKIHSHLSNQFSNIPHLKTKLPIHQNPPPPGKLTSTPILCELRNIHIRFRFSPSNACPELCPTSSPSSLPPTPPSSPTNSAPPAPAATASPASQPRNVTSPPSSCTRPLILSRKCNGDPARPPARRPCI